MTWRVSRTIIDFLSRDTKKLHNLRDEPDHLQKHIIETYHIALRRGLTPSDALAVAVAYGTRKNGPLWRMAPAETETRLKH
jgi:hypothetical protein